MKTFAMLATAAALALSALDAAAQGYPTQPVKIVVPFGAGGPADIYARYLGDKLQARLGQPFVIENRPGGGATIGTEQVVKAAPDGYTLLMMSNTHTTNETLMDNKGYALMDDLVAVAPVNESDLLMVVHPSVQANSVADFIALAKANPGTLNYASSGPGTPYHMAGELFKAMSGTDIVHVPHRSSGEARASVLGGHVQMMIDAVTTSRANAEAGKLRALGTSGSQRTPLTPDIPTISEAGVPGYSATIWLGVMAPKGTPDDVVSLLNREIAAIVGSDDTRTAWAEQGAQPLMMTPGAFTDFLRADIDKWAKVIEMSGAKTQ